MNLRFIASALGIIASLAACGGGGSGATVPPPIGTAMPTSTPTPGPATATGMLVDHDTGNPLPGIAVGLAPNIGGATPAPGGTTAANGSFTVQASPGTYLLVIGTNEYPDPSNRPTIHEMVTLAAGANALTAPDIGPAPTATKNPIEWSGNFRLTTLTTAEQNCLALENTTRQNHALATVASDEWLTEDNRGYWMVATATNSAPQYPGVLTNYNSDDGNGMDCSDMIAGDFALRVWPSYSRLAWYAGDSGGANNIADSEGMVDPRVTPYPTPTPSKPWP